jgi:acyl-CoA synthetase (AMP-forming)/AMP-acid ligase II
MITALPVRVVKSESNPELIDVAKNGAEIGEVVVTGNLCTKGYYKDPVGTQKLFEGGQLHTGDLAVMHPNGAIQVVDRAKDIIISGMFLPVQRAEVKLSNLNFCSLGGENISSVAVENVLMKHPDVIEAAVIGVPHEKWSETPKACITTVHDSGVEGEDIRKWARENSEIGGFMVPSQVEIVPELPKNSTGKMQKKVLREMEMKRRRRVANL